MAKRDWKRTGGFDISEHKMTLATIMAIAFIIPVYAYASGEYVEQSTLVTVGGDTLVDNNLYAMSQPIQMTNWTTDGHYSIRPQIYENYLLYYLYSGVLDNNITLLDLENLEEEMLHYDDNYSVRPVHSDMWGDYIVSDAEDLPYGVWLQKISTNETIVFMENQTNSDIWGNIVVTARNDVVANILTIYNIDTGEYKNITIGNCSRVYFPKIYDNRVTFCSYVSYGGANYFNLTYYDLDNDTVTVLLTNTAPTSYQFRPYIWGDNIIFARRVNVLSYYLWQYNIKTQEFTNLSALSINKGNVREYVSIWDNIIAFSTFNGSWKLEAYDFSTEEFFSLEFSETGGMFYPDIYKYENGDYIIAYQTFLFKDTYLIYLNSTANYHPNQIHITHEVQMQNVYDYNIVYGSIISMFVGLAILTTFYNYREELRW